MKLRLPSESQRGSALEPIEAGEYFHSERELFRVERCEANRVMLEDCRTGVLIDVELERLLELERVRR